MPKRGLFGAVRLRTLICRRKTRFSALSALSIGPATERPGDSQWVEDPRDPRGAFDNAMAFDGPAVLNVKLHHAAGRKPQEFGWLTT